MSSLFDKTISKSPLADRIRPKKLSEVFGQEHLLDKDSYLQHMLSVEHIASIVLWGPSGAGKTTLARILAAQSNCHFESVSAVTSGVQDLKKIFLESEKRKEQGINTLLLVDEIHRFNRTQQDAFLPHVENGTIILVGATTENPSFELNSALLSRCKILTLKRLDNDALQKIIDRAEALEDKQLPLQAEARKLLTTLADGDGRYLLNMCEDLFQLSSSKALSSKELTKFIQRRAPVYDKSRDGHYNLISALHKSLRGSDCDAALYWLCRMLDGGEDPLYIIRRLVRFAAEDVGLADPTALTQALSAKDAYDFLGSPEGELAIVQAVIYLATAPKSNASYIAYGDAKRDAKNSGSLMPPKHILNAPTTMMKEHGYGKNYVYDHETEKGFSGQNYFPEKMKREEYYKPVDRGFEREIKKRLDYWQKLRAHKNTS